MLVCKEKSGYAVCAYMCGSREVLISGVHVCPCVCVCLCAERGLDCGHTVSVCVSV